MRDQKLNHKLNVKIGNWDTKTVMLDFDKTPLGLVKLWCFRLYVWFALDGFIILESSKRILKAKNKKDKILFKYRIANYHVVFNRKVTWKQNVKIMNWIALESGIIGLQNYVRMQCIKGSSTLRSFPKPPRIVCRYGNRDKMIAKFLENRECILNFPKVKQK